MSEAFRLLRFLTPGRWLNLLLYTWSRWLSRLFRIPIVWNQPWAATIEPSSLCQLSCPECPVGMKQITRKSALMSAATFDAVLGNLSPKTFYLNLYFQGEPLLDPDIIRKIEKAHKRRLFVALSTNAMAIEQSMAEALCQSRLSKIIISLDGADNDSYEQYRSGGNQNQVLEAIQHLSTARQKVKNCKLIIEVQMLVFSFNEDQRHELKKLALKHGADHVVFKAPQFYDSVSAAKNMSSLPAFQRYKRNADGSVFLQSRKVRFCKRLWSTLVVNSDGVVSACCYDKFSQYIMGRADEKKAALIWKGDLYCSFRKEWLRGRGPAMCSNCDA